MTKATKFLQIVMITVIAITLIFAVSCHRKSEEKLKNVASHVITVKMQSITKPLYFNGIIQPVTLTAVPSPVSGNIQTLNFHYGEDVKKGDVLMAIYSPKQKTDFQNDLTQFLRTKYDEATASTRLHSNELLYKKGIISEEELKRSESDHYFSHLALLQAEQKLREKHNLTDILGISVGDESNIKKALSLSQKSEKINIYASASGIVLFPPGDGAAKKLTVGSSVKEAETLVNIGDISGISLEIKADETSINDLKVGQEASVTTPVSPNILLKGMLTSIDKQASSTYGAPTFVVNIKVPNLTPEEQKFIHVGMTAEIKLLLKKPPQLVIPIKAIIRKEGNPGGEFFVDKVDAQGKRVEVPVHTGLTTQNSVVITHGLKEGDQIVVFD